MLATWELAAAIAGTPLTATAPDANTAKDRTEMANFRMRDFRAFIVIGPAQTVQQRDRPADFFYEFLT
jgi:hypothetical protein